MTRPTTRVGVCKRIMLWLLPLLLPPHGRRAIFLTTLFVEIAKISPDHRKFLEDLNRHLKIVNKEDALNLPIQLHGALWRERPSRLQNLPEGLTESEIDGIVSRVISEFPVWSRYDDYTKVWEETREVIRACLSCRTRVA